MGNLGLALAMTLSAVAGAAVLSPVLWNGAATRWQTLIGYGFAGGLVLTTLIMRAGFAAKLGLSFGVTAAGLIVVAAGGVFAHRLLRKWGVITPIVESSTEASRETGWRRRAWFAAAPPRQ